MPNGKTYIEIQKGPNRESDSGSDKDGFNKKIKGQTGTGTDIETVLASDDVQAQIERHI